MNWVAIALFIIMLVILTKFKLVCEVTANGEKLGYIENKEIFEKHINSIVNKKEENKLYTKIALRPEYNFILVNKNEQTNEKEILAKIEESSETIYQLYAVTIEGKEKVIVADLEEAENLVKELNKKYAEKLNKKIAIVKKETNKKNENVLEISVAKENLTKELKKINTKTYSKIDSSTKTYKSNVKSTKTSVKIAKVSKDKTTKISKKSESVKETEKITTASSNSNNDSLNGIKLSVIPVSGKITSRFGNRESIRRHRHTGLDISAPKGTKIRAAASGTVIFSGYSGAYGNVVKISHGSGVKTYYAHCSKLYVKKGQKVTAGDIIAAVGSTGNSTGNHLHFEIVKNGTSINPQKYLY